MYCAAVFMFFGELTNMNQNLIWLLRTLVGQESVLYLLNGLMFAAMFVPIRTVVMGWHFKWWLERIFTNHADECLTIGTACSLAWPLGCAFYIVGLLWVWPVINKTRKGLRSYWNSGTKNK